MPSIIQLAEARRLLATATEAARVAGAMMRRNLRATKKVLAAIQHDVKLDLDVRCQKRIERLLCNASPEIAVLGEEGVAGDAQAPWRWVVDPIDGTVNFAYGIPHACVSIALQHRAGGPPSAGGFADGFETALGVVYHPFCDELWTAVMGQPARLNGRIIRVSTRRRLAETIISLGFAKHRASLKEMLPGFQLMVHRVRKIRIMGSAALDLVYVASGRLDAYIEAGVRLWDVAAGGLIVECAGGEFWRRQLPGEHFYHIVATNGLIRRRLLRFI